MHSIEKEYTYDWMNGNINIINTYSEILRFIAMSIPEIETKPTDYILLM